MKTDMISMDVNVYLYNDILIKDYRYGCHEPSEMTLKPNILA